MISEHPLAPLIGEEGAAERLGKAVGCSVWHLRNIRDGRKSASLELALKLAKETGLPVEVFKRAEQVPPQPEAVSEVV